MKAMFRCCLFNVLSLFRAIAFFASRAFHTMLALNFSELFFLHGT